MHIYRPAGWRLLAEAVLGPALPAPQTLISGGSEAELADQLSDAAFNVVADRPDGGGIEAGGVVEVSQDS